MRNHKPLISVITICLNASNFIEQTIQSVINQTYPNREYIIIDGGSTDGTVQIIRKYESHVSYWHSKLDEGVSHAFNLGLAQARGDWVIFLNADDFFLTPSVLEQMVSYLSMYSEFDVVYGDTIIMLNQRDPQPAPLRKIYGSPFSWRKFKYYDLISHQSAFTNRNYFAKFGNFNESYRLVMDYEIFLRAGKYLSACHVPIPISGMRERGVSNKNAIKTYLECRRAHHETKALSNYTAGLNCFSNIFHHYLGRIAHKILDRYAAMLSFKRRNRV